MPTQSALALVNALAEGGLHTGAASLDGALREQAAFVRSLVDEVQHHHPSDRRVAPLHEQLGEELVRLAELVTARAKALAPITEEDVERETRPIDVLVVDDQNGSLRAAMAAVRSLGYPCRGAPGAQEALCAYAQQPAAIVFSDWSMPGMSGHELCLELKLRQPSPYVILATAFHDNAGLLDGMRGDADDFLGKPIDLDELKARLLGGSRLIRAVRVIAALKKRLDVRKL